MLRFLSEVHWGSVSDCVCLLVLVLVIGGCGVFTQVPKASRFQGAQLAETLTDLTGTWSSKTWCLQLSQTNSQVTGFMPGRDIRIEGIVKDDRLIAIWFDRDAQRAGRFQLEISVGGDSLMGTSAELEGKWKTNVSPLILVRKEE